MGKLFVFGLDERGGLLGGFPVFGGDGRDGLARVAHLSEGEDGLIAESGAVAGPDAMDRQQVLTGEHGRDSGDAAGRTGVHAEDLSVRVRTPRQGQVERAGKHLVGEISLHPPDFRRAVESENVMPDDAPFY
jgi:hypothetical protein